jgi:amidophosphoribosyltransferase
MGRSVTMCGILAILLGDPSTHVSQLLVDGLTVLQHRGQGKSFRPRHDSWRYVRHVHQQNMMMLAASADAAGVVTADGLHLNLHKDNGLVAEVFHQHHMEKLRVGALS